MAIIYNYMTMYHLQLAQLFLIMCVTAREMIIPNKQFGPSR